MPDDQGLQVRRARDLLAEGEQRGELVAGGGRVTCLPGTAGELVPDGEGVRVVGAENPLANRQQHGELVARRGRVTRLRGEAGEVSAGAQGARVLGAVAPFSCPHDVQLKVAGGGVAAALAQGVRDPRHAVAVIGERDLGVRQQHGAVGQACGWSVSAGMAASIRRRRPPAMPPAGRQAAAQA